jgi:hypothetical protein
MMCANLRGSVLLLALVTILSAQTVSSSLLGTVNDPSGSPVPNADIELTSKTTGEHLAARTNSDGLFRFPVVEPDRYRLSIRANGFKAYSLEQIQLASSETRDLGSIVLVLGSLQESVTVEANTTPLETASSEKSSLVTGQQLNDIALKGRDFFGLMYTVPGVVDTSTTRDATSPNALSGITINGGRNASKNFTVDGITDMDTGSNTTLHFEPNIDSIAEVRVLTSNYQAEFGRNGGGTISAVTKSGTQEFHGSGWWQHRNEGMNANLWNNNRNGLARAPYRLGIEGYTIGGPFYIPHHFNSDKRRVFFFVSEEWTGQKVNSSPATGNMPTQLERSGDFSKSFDTGGSLIAINDPSTGKPFPGNLIPASRINSVGQATLNFFPLPNYPTSDPSLIYQENYAATPLASHTRRNDVVRVDYNITSKLAAYFRYINDHDETIQNNHDIGNFVGPQISHPNPGHGYAGHLTWTISPTLVNETTLGKTYNTWDWFAVDPSQWDRSKMGNIPKWYPIDLTLGDQANYIPDVSFGGTPVNAPSTSPNNDIPYYNANNIYTITDNISKVLGRHNLKAGVYFERNQKIEDQEVATWLGAYNFGTDANNPFDTGNGFANALLGNFDTYTETNSRLIQRVWFTDLEWYAQDNWRVSKRLTVDIGLRFYHVTPQADQHHAFAGFDPSQYSAAQAPVLFQPVKVGSTRMARNPLTGQTYPAAYIGLFVPGSGNAADGAVIGGVGGVPRGVYSAPGVTYGPRLGFAWDVFGNGKTAIRGGIGLFQDTIDGNPSMNMSGNPPISYTPTAYYGNLSTLTQSGGLIGPSSILYLFGNERMPRTVSYSLGVQQAVGFGVLDVSYVGNFSRHLLWERNINPIPIGAHFATSNQDPTQSGKPLPDTFLVPYRGWSSLLHEEFAGTANYNSLQVALNRRFSRGLMFGAAYTYSKVLGEANSETGAVSAYFSPRQRNYQLLSFNRAQVLAVSYSYEFPRVTVPGGRVTSTLVNGWTWSGITIASTGAPLTPSFSLSPSVDITGSSTGSAGDNARLNLVCNPKGGSKAGTSQIFNAGCFQMPAVGAFGNAGLGYLTGPGYMNWDMALAKKILIGLGERRQLQFRGETFNTFNHTEYNALNSSVRFNSKTGAITNLGSGLGDYTGTRPARILALSVRFQF